MRAEMEQMNRGAGRDPARFAGRPGCAAGARGRRRVVVLAAVDRPQSRFDHGVASMQKPPARLARRPPQVLRAAGRCRSGHLERTGRPSPPDRAVRPGAVGSRGKREGSARRSEAERLLHVALHAREIGDLAQAERMLVALRTLLGENEEDSKTHEFAGRLLDEVRQARERPKGEIASSNRSLARADRLAEEGIGDPGKLKAAREIWKSIVELYSGDSSAAAFVSQGARGKPPAPPPERISSGASDPCPVPDRETLSPLPHDPLPCVDGAHIRQAQSRGRGVS